MARNWVARRRRETKSAAGARGNWSGKMSAVVEGRVVLTV